MILLNPTYVRTFERRFEVSTIKRRSVEHAEVFFHVFDHPNELDCEGTVLEHAEEARKQAIAYASEILDGKRDTVRPGEAWHMHVTDEHNAPMFRLDFSITDTSKHGMVSEVA